MVHFDLHTLFFEVNSQLPPSQVTWVTGWVCWNDLDFGLATYSSRTADTMNTTKPKSSAGKAKPTPANAPPTSGRWLLKSEPDAFSWDDLVARGRAGEPWSGVRNYQARNFMTAMQVGDLCFFYHSNEGLAVVGICEVIAPAHPDPTDNTDKWECVDVRHVCPMPQPVTLAAVKANPRLASMSLVTSFRLSVQPVTRSEWDEVCRMGGLDPKSIGA